MLGEQCQYYIDIKCHKNKHWQTLHPYKPQWVNCAAGAKPTCILSLHISVLSLMSERHPACKRICLIL